MKIARGLSLQRMLDVVWENFRELMAIPFLGGKTITWEGSSGGAIVLRHGLGRLPVGFLVIRHVGCVVLYEHAATATDITLEIFTYSSTARAIVRVF